MPLPIPVHLDEQLGGVSGGRGVCVQQDVLVLRQVLGGCLLGSTSAVQQLSLQQREVGLENKRALLYPGSSSCSQVCSAHLRAVALG